MFTSQTTTNKDSEIEDSRNIINYYKYWETDAIKADLDSKRFNYSILCSNIHNDFNIGTCIRNANAFLAKEVIIYGKKKWDRRAAVGTQNYTDFNHVRESEDLSEVFSKYDKIVGIDNVDSAKDIAKHSWNKDAKTLICFGQEQVGLPEEVLSACDEVLYIQQYGSVRSLNVGVASGITMYDYVSKTQKE